MIHLLLLRKTMGCGSGDLLLLSVGELNENKNHEVVIRALAQINNPQIHYAIAGQGNLKEYLEELSVELKIEKRVHLLGFRNDMFELYKAADIFIFPSKREGLSVALMEAMACGLTCVVSNIRGNIDLIRDKSMHFEPDNPEDLKRILINLMVSNTNITLNSNQADIQKFELNAIKNKIKEIYMMEQG